MLNADLLTIFRAYLTMLGLGLVSWPLVKSLFRKLPDQGWSLTRITTTLMAALSVWELGNMGLVVNNTKFLLIITSILMIINVLIAWDKGRLFFKFDNNLIKIIVLEEYLFGVGLFAVCLARGFLPNIDSLEKFMDFGFVNRYLTSPELPTMDMWQAGKIINYYSFGHFWSSIIIRYLGVPAAVGYNIMLGIVAGLTMQTAFGVSLAFAKGKNTFTAMMGGVISAFAVAFAGNSHIIWYLIKNFGLKSYWYADATRFIFNTIHEFPGYSFVVADLHGHLLDLPVVLTFLLVATHWIYNRKIIDEIILGILFGVMMMTNTWDVAVYGLILVVAGLQILLGDRKSFLPLIRSAGIMMLSMAITALPWWLSFSPISDGIALVTVRSEIWQLCVLWTGGIATCLIALITEGRGERKVIIRTLALTVFMLIAIPEFIYARDIYPDHPRANTMFKLTYQASVMIGLLVGYVLGKLADRRRKMPALWRIPASFLVLSFFCGAMIFPAVSFTSFYNNFAKYQGLNGENWLADSSPEKYGAVKYLRDNIDGRNLVEAVGDSYTNQNAISVFSGVPSIQGWRVHEWLWRGGYDVVAARAGDVQTIYEGVDINKTNELLKKYKIGWIFVGEDEKKQYVVDDTKIKSLGNIVWGINDSYLLKVN